jgi:phosphate uptake regulator
MAESPETIGRCLNWIVAAKNQERTADNAKNIAGDVIFLCEAVEVRHHALKN